MTEEFNDFEGLSKSIDDFTNHLFQCIARERRDNFVISALNVHCTLAMCLLGTKGNTTEEMQVCLKLENPFDCIYWRHLLKSLENIPNVNLSIASKMFGDQSIVVKDSFINSLKRHFNSEIESVNFNTNPANAVEAINSWCAKKTNDKIKKIIGIDNIGSTTRMILVGAVYFKAFWSYEYRFPSICTSIKPFYTNKNTQKDVLMMRQSCHIFYKNLKDLDAQSVAIPYENKDFLFVIIIPKKINGLERLEKKIHKIQINYEDFSKDENIHPVSLMLPKFKINTSLDLKYYLIKMGMIDAFTRNANFKGISEKPSLEPPLHIDNFCHEAFIDVNETGSEAAACSLPLLRAGGCIEGPPIQYINVTVDRPFLFKIVNLNSKITLFNGHIVDPVY